MMMKRIYFIISFILVLSPSQISAKTAPLTVVTNAIEEAEKEIEKFQDNLEVVTDIKMMINSARDELNSIKEEAQKAAMAYALTEAQKVIAKNKTLSGIADKMNFGDFVTAATRDAYNDKYVFKSDTKNDVEEKIAYDETINEELINNVSAMYARALARRFYLQNESADLAKEENEQNDISDEAVMINTIKNVKMRANKRWIDILISMSGDQRNQATINMKTLTQISDTNDAELAK